jgi:hypothetical protein
LSLLWHLLTFALAFAVTSYSLVSLTMRESTHDDAFVETKKETCEMMTMRQSPILANSIHLIKTDAKKSMAPLTRELCAMESAAKNNPNTAVVMSINVSVLYANRIVRALLANYPNMSFRRLDMTDLVKDTPFQGWYQRSGIESVDGRLPYVSDCARAAILYKHGGWYMDNDVIILKSLERSNLTNVIPVIYQIKGVSANADFLHFTKAHAFLDDYMNAIKER